MAVNIKELIGVDKLSDKEKYKIKQISFIDNIISFMNEHNLDKLILENFIGYALCDVDSVEEEGSTYELMILIQADGTMYKTSSQPLIECITDLTSDLSVSFDNPLDVQVMLRTSKARAGAKYAVATVL